MAEHHLHSPAPLLPQAFPVAELAALIKDQVKAIDIMGCEGALKPYMLSLLQKELERPIITITRTTREAERLAGDLSLFARSQAGEHLANSSSSTTQHQDSSTWHGSSPVAVISTDNHSPYSAISPERTSVMERLSVLYRLTLPSIPSADAPPLLPPIEHLVLSASSLSTLMIPPRALTELTVILEECDQIDRDGLARELIASGYLRVPLVEEPGTFSIRGSVIDVFSPLYPQPVRLELWGDLIETMGFFSCETQRTMEPLSRLHICPVREETYNSASLDRARGELVELADQLRIPSSRLRNVLGDLANKLRFSGMERLLPAFHELEPVTEYLWSDPIFAIDDPDAIADQLQSDWDVLHTEYKGRFQAGNELIFPPDQISLPPQSILTYLSQGIRLRTAGFTISPNWPDHPVPKMEFGSTSHQELKAQMAGVTRNEGITTIVSRHIHHLLQNDFRVAITSGTRGRSLRLRDMFKPHGFRVEILPEPFTVHGPGSDNLKPGCLNIVEGGLSSGFTLPVHRLAILSEQELFGEKSRRSSRRKGSGAEALFAGFSDLTPGDMVVHTDHGIGRYGGLVKLAVAGVENDYLLIEYQGNDKLYVPVQRLHGVQRYMGGSHDSVRLDRLGSTSWERTKQRVRKNVQKLAENLLRLYAARKNQQRDLYPEPDDLFREFEAAFPYDETPDQERAINDVIDDMTASNMMMDRLVCGDVGYGKTEVAIRAALLAALGGKQVAMMVPTTVLAGQHYRTFSDRLKNLPVNVGLVSRFVPAKKQREVLTRLGEGKIDIIIGTHRLLSKDVKFKDLGLLIIDEEHRFGVAAKEKLKAIKHDVDVLTLTATPIPRTLNMAISGLRDFSIMATPPMDRLSVRTMVTRPDDEMIRQGIMDELKRGGQVFYIHNRIASMPKVHEYLTKLVPEARIGVGHGRMGETDLERVMVDFIEGRTNVLLSTAIVESGLDIPRANTMFIDMAHMFGLADLYQLRGRVGRGRVRAYAFLLVPERRKLTDEARMRLDVLQRFTELGAGFQIASHDLEIRGAGEILGGSQSGHVASVGLELYTELLEEAVQEARGEEHRTTVEPELKLPVSAYLPEAYISHIGSRLALYKRFSMATSQEEVWSVLEEIADRYGPPPEEVNTLARVMCIKTMAREAGLETVEMDQRGTRLTLNLGEHPRLTPDGAMELIHSEVRKWRLTPDMKLGAALMTETDQTEAGEDVDPLEEIKKALTEMLQVIKEQ